MTDNLDRDPAQSLDDLIFQAPENMDERWQAVHQEIVSRLRQEAAGLPMQTVHKLLLERLANYYVTMRMRETETTVTASQMKDMTTFWLSMTQEFNKQLKEGQDKLRDQLLSEVEKVTLEAVDLIEDKPTRQKVRLKLSEGFAAINV